MSVCNFCKKAFASDLNRDNHIQNFHNNEINSSKKSTNKKSSNKESSNKELTNKKSSNEESSDKVSSNKELTNKKSSNEESSDKKEKTLPKEIKKNITLNYNSGDNSLKFLNPNPQIREKIKKMDDGELVKQILTFPNDSDLDDDNDGFNDDDDGFYDDDYDIELDYDDDENDNYKIYAPEKDDLPDQTNEKAVIDYKFNKLIQSMINPNSIESGRPKRRHIKEYKFRKIYFEAINQYVEIVLPPVCDRFKNFFVFITDIVDFYDYGYIYNKIYNDFSGYDKAKLSEELEGGKIYSLSDRVFNPEQERILQRFLCFMKKDPKLINVPHEKIKILLYNTIKPKKENNDQKN
jgi:hypothetical protein